MQKHCDGLPMANTSPRIQCSSMSPALRSTILEHSMTTFEVRSAKPPEQILTAEGDSRSSELLVKDLEHVRGQIPNLCCATSKSKLFMKPITVWTISNHISAGAHIMRICLHTCMHAQRLAVSMLHAQILDIAEYDVLMLLSRGLGLNVTWLEHGDHHRCTMRAHSCMSLPMLVGPLPILDRTVHGGTLQAQEHAAGLFFQHFQNDSAIKSVDFFLCSVGFNCYLYQSFGKPIVYACQTQA